MTDPRTCSRCGAPLAADGVECPRCLLRLGLELPPRDPGGPSAPAPETAAPRGRPVALPLDEVARRFPQLEIKALVGQGGMGVVYRARQPRLGRDVALKLLPPEQSRDPTFAERFLREARAMARLAHPNIVAVHDFGETDGLCWLLMDFVDGVNLRQALRDGALPPAKALAIVPQMCDALQYAHDEGVVHRDIKPENVLVDRLGRVKIADFGLAKLMGREDVTLTGEQQVFGTPHYMAPEQMEAARDVDHRADIFSLGVVFYEMLTGRLPVGRFEPPSRRVAVDVRLDDVVLHALEHEPERRYQHAAEVKTDVESVVAGREPAAARAAGSLLGDLERLDEDLLAATGLRGASKGPLGFAAEVKPGPLIVGGLQATWVGVSMILWPIAAWRLAGEAATLGAEGLAAGVALLAATAGLPEQVFVHAAPALRDALAAEPAGRKALRAAVAFPALIVGLLLLGIDVAETWERGTLHYLSAARSPQSLFVPAPEQTAALLAPLGLDVPPADVRRLAGSAFWEAGTAGISAGQAYVTGLLLLAAFGAALVLRAPGLRGSRAWLGPVLLVPVLLLAGLRLTAVWSDVRHEAESWPDLAAVNGSEPLDLGVHAAAEGVRQGLRSDGYDVHGEQVALLVTADGVERAREIALALEPAAPWDRWDLEDGLPRRRRPHVALRFVGDEERCVVSWDCGHVRPLAGEPDAWREWVQRILRDARRFAETASGG